MEIFVLQLYHQVYDERAKDACLQLVGIVTYYGKHYSTFFFHSKLRTWIYFDDARVKEVSNPLTSRSNYLNLPLVDICNKVSGKILIVELMITFKLVIYLTIGS